MTDYAQIRKQLRNSASNNNNNSNNNYDDDALEQLRQDMRDLHTAMRKQKGEWVRQLNDALGKIDQQGKVIAAQQVEIDALKRQLSSSSGNNNNNNNSNNSNSNNYLSHNSKSLLDSSSTSLGRSNNTNNKKLSKSNKPTSTTTTTTTTTTDNEGSESSCELPGLLDGFLTKNSKPKTPTNGNNNSGSDFISMAGESFMQDSFRPMEDDCLDEGDGDVELEFDFSVLNNDNGDNDDNEQPQDNDNNAATTTPFPKGKCNRRGSLDSVQTIDLEEPRKKTISLLPHKSVQIYNEQRADAALRKLMRRANGNNNLQHISVRKVHKKNLVFYQDRIYIPAGLTTKTMEFYFKKYRKQTPILHLEKNCYWPTMREDMKKYENKAQGMNWKVRIS